MKQYSAKLLTHFFQDHIEFMVLALQLYDVYRESILGFASKKALAGKGTASVAPTSRINVMFCVAGFRPGRRGPFVSAKGPKTNDAPPGFIGWGGHRLREGGPTRCAQTRPA
ncbi:hypothetical protein [Nitrospira sp. Ecomares 2.1]